VSASATLETSEQSATAVPVPAPWWRVALPVVGVTAAVVTIGSAGRELWIDEYVTWFSTTLSWAELHRLLGNIDIVHALYYLVMRLWTAAVGDSPLALRLPSIIGMTVAAGALALLGRRWYDTTVGVTAGLLFAAVPTVSRYGQEARSYAWVTALAVLSTLALLRALDRPSWRRFLLYGGCTLALVLLHFVAALVVVAHLPLVWRAARRGGGRRVVRAWLGTMLLLALSAAPMLYEASTQSGQVSWIRNDRPAVARYPGELFGSPTVAWVLVPIALLGAVVLWYTRPALIPPLLLWAVLPPVFCYLSFAAVHLFLAKYVLFTLPAWALLAAVAIAVPVSGLRRWLLPVDTAVVLALAILSVAAAGLTGQREARRSPVAGEADFRAVADMIDDRYRPGDGIAYAGWDRSRAVRLPMLYELRTRPVDVFVTVPPGKTGSYGATECPDPAPCLTDTQRIWMIVDPAARDPFDGLPPARADLLRRAFTVASTDVSHRVKLVLVVHR
jgi:mannosyltransferase